MGGTSENPSEKCYNVTFNGSSINASSIDIFTRNFTNPETSGDGIEFYSEPFGWSSGAKAGKCFLSQKAGQSNFTQCSSLGAVETNLVVYTQDMAFDYTNVDRPQEYKQLYTNFQKRPGSIRIKGNYLVALYAQNYYCQTFYKDIPNLNEMEFTAQGNNITSISVIPTK
jgi:hypothetical protein